MNNIGRAFSYMFEDKNWFGKIFIGGLFCLLSFVFIGMPFVFGYILEVVKRSSENKGVPLPEWDDLGGKFTRGLIYIIILIIYVLPGSLLSMSELFCFSFLWWIAMLFVIPYITVRYSLSGNFADAFQFKQMFEFVKLNFSNIFIVVLLSIALSILSSFGILFLVVGVFFTWFWASLGIGYLYGQLYHIAMQKAEAKSESDQV